MHLTRPVRAHRREEILRFEPAAHVVEFLAVAREEDLAGAWAVADADDVALDVVGGVGGGGEGLVVAAVASGEVGEGVFVVACCPVTISLLGLPTCNEHRIRTRQPEQRIRLRRQPNTDGRVLRLVIDLRLPVVDLVLLGDGQVGLHAAFRIVELDLGARFDEAVCDFELRLEFPG